MFEDPAFGVPETKKGELEELSGQVAIEQYRFYWMTSHHLFAHATNELLL